jgi:hypothetical protein
MKTGNILSESQEVTIWANLLPAFILIELPIETVFLME